MPAPAGHEGPAEPGGETAQLRQELSSTREYLQSLIEQQDAANEELRSANEEILSSNEELQSTNEELETANEELQSTNEELSTVNEQLQHRNLEVNQTTNDLQNLLSSTAIPVVMVGPDLRIRRLTPPARKIMNLLPADLGRPIGDFRANVDVPDLEALIAEVIDEVQHREREVRDRGGRRYALRVHPYRTSDDKIDGAVLVLLDIEDLKRSQEEAGEARDYAEAIVATVREPLLVLDEKLRVLTANAAFYRTFGVQAAETHERLVYDLGNRQWDIPALRILLEQVLPHEHAFERFEVQHHFPQIGQKTMLLNARGLYRAGLPSLILLAIEDITERKEAEAALRESEARFRTMADAAPVMIWMSGTDKGCTYFNKPWLDFAGRTMEQESGQGWAERVHPDEHARCLGTYVGAFDARRPFEMEYRLRRHDGEYRWILDIGTPRMTGGCFEGYIGSCIDITDRKRMEEALRDSEERLSLAVHGTGMATWDSDLQTGQQIWSENYFRILGYAPTPGGKATVEMWRERVHPEDLERRDRALAETRRERSVYTLEYRIVRADDGEVRWLSAFGRFLYDEAGAARRFVGVCYDITERREAKALSHQASHDSLTGLVNRTELERRLERVLAGVDVQNPHALLFLDLDQFKLVNDTCGHAAGDELLRQLAAVLEAKTRKRDTLARLGGDEFGVLLEHCAPEQALRIARGLVQ
ncbi:MAG: PAS domain S-box protein, partial [Gammaproteobacteria bacterium]